MSKYLYFKKDVLIEGLKKKEKTRDFLYKKAWLCVLAMLYYKSLKKKKKAEYPLSP